MFEVGKLRIKNNKCQILVKTEIKPNEIQLYWRDYIKHYLENYLVFIDSKHVRLITLVSQEFPKDEVEVFKLVKGGFE